MLESSSNKNYISHLNPTVDAQTYQFKQIAVLWNLQKGFKCLANIVIQHSFYLLAFSIRFIPQGTVDNNLQSDRFSTSQGSRY